ncbi:unnamed protein product [Closterium sp. NIES-53]
MSKVLIAEGLGYNLLSDSQLMAKGIHLEADSTTLEFKLYNGKGGLYIGKAVLKNNVFVLDFIPDLDTADSDGIKASGTRTPSLRQNEQEHKQQFNTQQQQRQHRQQQKQHRQQQKQRQPQQQHRHQSQVLQLHRLKSTTLHRLLRNSSIQHHKKYIEVQTSPQASTPTPTCIVAHPDIALAKTSSTYEWDIQATRC